MTLPHIVRSILALSTFAVAALADDWPQFRGTNRDAVWKETGIMQTFPSEGLKNVWRTPVGYGMSSPVVAQGRVYLMGSTAQKPQARERMQCWDEKSGHLLWSYVYDVSYPEWCFDPPNRIGPNATPIVEADKIYGIGATGQLLCLDAIKGTVVWQKKLTAEYGLEEFSGNTPSPLIEGNLLIVVIGGNPKAWVVAFDKNTGKEVWRALDDKGTYSSPMVISAGGQRQLIVWTPNAVTSLNPATGETWWREPLSAPGALTCVVAPVRKGDRLLISGLMFQLDASKPAASVLWPESKSTAKRVLSQTSIPIIDGDYIFSGKIPGKLVCLEAATGKLVWETDKVTTPGSAATIQITPQGDSVLIFTDEGNLIRARLTAQGYEELSRVHVIDPTLLFGGRKVVWPPPTYANQHLFTRNEDELGCFSLEAKP